jgi:BTB/POZ domain
METSVSATQKLQIKTDSKQMNLRLRMCGGMMEWSLYFKSELIKSEKDPYPYSDLPVSLYSTFRLVPTLGRNFLSTASYNLEVTSKVGNSVKKDGLLINQEYKCSIGREKGLGGMLTLDIKILLKAGQVTSINSSNRLFNSREHSDIELKCGDQVIPAHKYVLSYHSATFRTVFSSTRFVEGKEGVYKISSEHMNPNILKDVIRYQCCGS